MAKGGALAVGMIDARIEGLGDWRGEALAQSASWSPPAPRPDRTRRRRRGRSVGQIEPIWTVNQALHS